ncbi:hypothetical protein J2R76_000106 [Bradyrhizobium sp. USDA 4532]|uniref:hypothetical protein n=1 Tax=unclassified Bradyrhizobium TaxID=2631580 RepID=UPI00209CC9ED|nr:MULTISPECIES: hypothetical protein [unclassified Bradyrhizobium]MCP1831678.1 hypothetical protein [Bradyrhizobium sp. USDA 4545]MCP1916515.1 hypothetical protein [Bradyrhizobium sp. USDA 4532]
MANERKIRIILLGLLTIHIVATCVSLVYTSHYHPELFIRFDPQRLPIAVLIVAAFSLVGLFFLFSRFSFGYLIGFYLYTMIVGFLFLNVFTIQNYDHHLAATSAIASAILFLLPSLFLNHQLRPVFTLSHKAFDALLVAVLFFSLLTVLVGAIYNFRAAFSDFGELRDELFTARLRNQLKIPPPLGYAIGILSSALLPYAFACFVARAQFWKALLSLALLALFFPVTLSKTALFTPAWLIFVAILGRIFEVRIAAMATLAIPILIGSSAVLFGKRDDLFELLAFRMIDIPSAALAIYNEFFAGHERTHFCHLSFARMLMPCPYQDQLGVVMAKAYGLGNYNASLFATEGIASVGLSLAPVSAFVCGLFIGFGNCLSARLPSNVLLISSCVLSQVILNVPLSTALLTYGAGTLLFLWYISPPDAFPRKPALR